MTVGDALRPVQRPRLYEQVANQIQAWITENALKVGDRLPPERELASRLGVSRATVSQALVAMEVVGMVSVRHGDEALETKLAALAADRRSESDLAAMYDALALMERDIATGGRGVEGDERFHAAVTAAGHSPLLAKLMAEISDLIRETRISSLSQPDRPVNSLRGHRKIADAIRAGDAEAAAQAMQEHVAMVSDVAILRD
jgi:GntR family transcriptional repressor for pyruvate dehydrogenase complex